MSADRAASRMEEMDLPAARSQAVALSKCSLKVTSDPPRRAGYVTIDQRERLPLSRLPKSPGCSQHICRNSVYYVTLRRARESNSSRRPDGPRAFEGGGLAACAWILSRCAGFELTQRFGSSAAFLSAGGYH